jgi:zinc protease
MLLAAASSRRTPGPPTLLALACLAASACTRTAPHTAGAMRPAGVPLAAEDLAFEAVTAVEGVTEYRLANGLRALLFPDPSTATVTVSVTYLVGSRHESYGETGIAHLLEHLLFRGTARHPDPGEALEARGAVYNAETGADATVYHEALASTADLPWVLDLEADRMTNLSPSQAALDLERSIVRNEMDESENAAERVLEQRVRATAYLWDGYGRATIGAPSDVDAISLARVRAFYRRWYRPDNAVLLVAGDFDEQAALHAIRATFGRVPRPARPLPATHTREPVQDGERSVVLRRDGGGPYVAVAWHVPGAAHPDTAPLDVLATILGDEPSGRIYRTLVTARTIVSGGAAVGMGRERGLFMARATVRSAPLLPPARDRLTTLVERAGDRRPSHAELERARQRLLAGYETTLNDTGSLAAALARWTAHGDWRLLFLHRDRIGEVTADDVQRVARTYLVPANRTAGTLIPGPAALAAIPESTDLAALAGYGGQPAATPGEAIDTEPLALEARVDREEVGRGIRLAALRKKTRGDVVFLRMSLDLGDEERLRGRAEAGALCGGLLMRGTVRHTRKEIEDRLDALGASLVVDGGAEEAGISLDVPRAHLAEALRLVAEVVREPVFPPDQVELYRQEWLDAVESSRFDPRMLADHELARHLQSWPADHPRYEPTPEESVARIQALTADDARRFHEEFYGASSAQVALVGDVPPAEIEALVRELFGDWTSRDAYRRIAPPFSPAPAGRAVVETPVQGTAVFQAATPIEVTDTAADYPPLLLGTLLTGGLESSRLWQRVREREGLSYGVESALLVDAVSPRGLFTVTATSSPGRAGRVEAVVVEELGRILRDGFDAAELERARETWRVQRRLAWAQDDLLADALLRQAAEARTFRHEAELERRVAAVTPESLRAAMRRHISLDALTVVIAGAVGEEKPVDLATVGGR